MLKAQGRSGLGWAASWGVFLGLALLACLYWPSRSGGVQTELLLVGRTIGLANPRQAQETVLFPEIPDTFPDPDPFPYPGKINFPDLNPFPDKTLEEPEGEEARSARKSQLTFRQDRSQVTPGPSLGFARTAAIGRIGSVSGMKLRLESKADFDALLSELEMQARRRFETASREYNKVQGAQDSVIPRSTRSKEHKVP